MEVIDSLIKNLTIAFVEAEAPEVSQDATGETGGAGAYRVTGWLKQQQKDLAGYDEKMKESVRRLKDPNVSAEEKKEIKNWIVSTYESFVNDRIERFMRIRLPEFVHGADVDQDVQAELNYQFWYSFLLAPGKPSILSYDPTRPFLAFFNGYINKVLSSGYFIDYIKKVKVAKLGLGSKDKDDEVGSIPDPKAPDAKGGVEQLSMDEKDIAKDVVKGLERIVKSGNDEGGISPEQAELFMHTYALGRPFSMEKIKGLLNIKYNPSVAITDMKTKHNTPNKAMAVAGLTGERKAIFQRLLYRIEKLVTGGQKVSGKERNVPDLLTLPTAPMEESIIRLVELLKEWNNVNANVERSA